MGEDLIVYISYRNQLSNPSCLSVVCKQDSAKFTDTVRQRGLESSLQHKWVDGYFFFLQICFI